MLPDFPQPGPVLLKGARFDVRQVSIPTKETGQPAKVRELIVHPGAVVILPLLGDGQVALIRNRRWAVGEELWELPAGTLEPPEPPDQCAARELVEETGYQAGKLTHLTDFYSCPGFCTELLHAFLATDLTHVGPQLEETEQIIVEPTRWSRVLDMIRTGLIRDGKTIATLLYHATFMRNAD